MNTRASIHANARGNRASVSDMRPTATHTKGLSRPVTPPYSNQAMQRFLQRGVLQTKLTINQPGDALEQEADRVADKVMRMADPGSANPAQPVGAATGLQRCSCGKSAGTGTQCEECKTQAMQLQRDSASSSGSSTAPPIVHDVLNSPGSPLDAGMRRFMEPRFGYDFSGVRLHTDAKAAESARAVGALAYTVGNHIAFNTGQYSDRHESRHLLAHELAHVVQAQNSLGSTVQRKCAPAQKRVDNSPNEGQKPGYHELADPCLWLLFGFPIASSEFLLQFAPAVNQLAHFLSQHESAKLRLIGLTDCFGTDDSNRAISAARAQSVKNAFPDRLHSRIEVLPSNGKTFLFTNETAQKRSFNRSVQIEILLPKDVPCPRPLSFNEEKDPEIMRGQCGGGEGALKTAVKLAAVIATTTLSRVRNWKSNKGTRDLLDLFYHTRNDLQRQAAADKIVSQLGGIVPRLRAPIIECLVPGSPHYDQVCADNTIADSRGATVIVAPTFCFPQFLNITNNQQSQAVTVIHEFSHNVTGLSDFGKTYYEAATCSPTASTDALSPAQRLTHADTLACFTVAVGVRSTE